MIRSYRESDKPKLIDILRLNMPEYFDSSEEHGFEKYLDSRESSYFVFEGNETVLGGGGYHLDAEKGEGYISWDLVDPNSKGIGVGRKIMEHCLSGIRSNPRIHTIVVSTSQHAYRFYEKFGFKTKRIEKDFWGKGIDLYRMETRAHEP